MHKTKNANRNINSAKSKKKNNRSIFGSWKKIGFISLVALAVIILSAILLINIFSSDKNKTVFSLESNTPNPVQFSDKNFAIFANENKLPEINNNRDTYPIEDLILSYQLESGSYQSALKSNINDKDLQNKIQITPFIKGTWRIYGDSQIVFKPETDWPAGKKFTVRISEDILNPDIKTNKNKISFTTPEITANIESFNTYPAIKEKKSVIGVAVISFNYPIDTKGFKDKVSLKLDDEKLDFTVKYDRFDMTAMITTAPITITDNSQIIRLKINRVDALYGDSSTEKITAHETIESADNIFKISDLTTTVADNSEGNAEQLLLLNMTTAASSNTNWADKVNAYLLPEYIDSDEENEKNTHVWKIDEVTPEIIKESKKLNLKKVDFATPTGVYQYAFSYDVSDKNNRYIYVSVKNGIESSGGFILKDGLTKVMSVPYPAKEVKIAGSGALLSLSGEKKLGITARGGVEKAYVNLYKVKSSEINHLISQTYNIFDPKLSFKSWSFGVYDMSVVFQKTISFANKSMKETNYASVDLGDFLDRTKNDKTGIFIIQTGATESQAEYNDKRLVLLTDLGIIRKVNLDETSDVFISNLSDGTPASDVEISVLGRNGNAIWAGRTDSTGHTELPKFAWNEYRNAREPVAIVARRGNDVSFIPFNSYAQQVEYSKFDVDGTYHISGTPLNAYVFSDRGIYRPGENVIIAGIVKNKTFKSLSGIPVKIEIRDSRGRIVLENTISLPSDGMFNVSYDTPENAVIGDYIANVFSLNSNNSIKDMLGTTNFRVEEFVPDTMKITANINGKTENGWLSPENITADVTLRNLFGTPAQNRKITAYAVLSPINFSFDKYSDYKFTPNFISGTGLASNTVQRAQTITQELQSTETDDNGNAKINVKFDKIVPSGTYSISLNIKGYEADGGKSVQTNVSTRVSDAKYLVGYKVNSDLSYINRNDKQNIKVIAIDHTATPITVKDLTLRLIKQETLTSLVKDYNNYYKYQTISQDRIVSQNKIDISDSGNSIELDTKSSGTYVLQILDASDKILANINYYVAGEENLSLQTNTNAELQVKLNSKEYEPGQDIELNITAPYIGTGLITIERDKVYAYKWFNTNTTSSIQRITVPKDFEGTGYVNVSFVRDINSRDIFTSPYTYAVAPFSADVSKRKITVNLSAPKTISDNKLTIKYKTSKDANLMIFAINEGILQVAKYQIPNPLAHFFKKSALQVNTYQILSLLLPEYKILREFAKTGGGDYEGGASDINQILTNPFGRKTLPPVAFYSGIIKTKANTEKEISFDVPEYFSGSIKIFAVAANDSSVGSADTETTVKYPLTITTSSPLFVAPGDSFEINTLISNSYESEQNADNVTTTIKVSDNMVLQSENKASKKIEQNSEDVFKYSVKSTEKLGNAEISVNATLSDNAGKELYNKNNVSTLSIRPATTYKTEIRTGKLNSKTTKIKNFNLPIFPEHSNKALIISGNESSLALPLFAYLKEYDYSCSEQVVSKAMPYAVMPTDSLLGTTQETSSKEIEKAINVLKNRQNDDGSFSMWSNNNYNSLNNSDYETAYLTAYATEFLTIAKENGFNVPKNMLSRAINYLRSYAGDTISNNEQARSVAFAIYAITRNGYVTTSYIDTFEEYANTNMKNWEKEISGAYIAASYKLLKQDDLADKLIYKYKKSDSKDFEYSGIFSNNIADNAMYYYLTKTYFADSASDIYDYIENYINAGNYDSYTASIIVMALSGNNESASDLLKEITVTSNDKKLESTLQDSSIKVTVPMDAESLEITCSGCEKSTKLFYTLLQQGYPKASEAESNGLEVIREYYDQQGNRVTSGNIGDIITVKIFARTRGNVENASDVVISDLLPGGFIIDEIKSAESENIEVREDRVIIYTDLSRTSKEISYTAQLGSTGTFTIPGIYAESMYNSKINATGNTGTFKVLNEEN